MRSPIYPLSVSEYLEVEAESEVRHEYIDGQVFAMAGGSKRHNSITINIVSRIHSHVRGTSCQAYSSDVKVKIKATNQNKTIFYYPDVVVSCNQFEQDEFFLNYPCLVLEVLSPSTEMTDKREKLVNYQSISSVQEYVLVSQKEMKVEVYRRDLGNNWTVEILGSEDSLQLVSIDLNLTMNDIYEDVF